MRTSESTIEPPEIEIDCIRSGRATLICRWNAQQETRENEEDLQQIWVYDEAWIKWALPASFVATDGSTVSMPISGDPQDIRNYAEQYIQANSDEIMSYAMATTMRA
ncbi:MAG: hypothetical protein M0P69_21190 [Bacteroidales bacterium]|jgi:hypothetical protein|nr:hypothetical protein [Bacteroidales bacterium]MDD3399055.1 hypothetical protein [Candidatus Methanomethylophilaceae archaeon]